MISVRQKEFTFIRSLTMAAFAPKLREGLRNHRKRLMICACTAAIIMMSAVITCLYAFTDVKNYIQTHVFKILEDKMISNVTIKIWTPSHPNRDYSFIVLFFLNWNTPTTRSCGGTFITKTSILTAGHCLQNATCATTVDIILGVSNIWEATNWLNPSVSTTGKLIIHKNFDQNSYDNDIALIKLDGSLEISDQLNIVTLDFNYKNKKTSRHATVLGWGLNKSQGLNDELLNKSVNLIDNEACFNFYQEDNFVIDNSKIICTSGYQGPCHSNSGGPLLLGKSQIGIVSAGDENCTPYTPTRHMNLGYYKEWIQGQTSAATDFKATSLVVFLIIHRLLIYYFLFI